MDYIMFAKLSYYAHSAQDELANLLPYEHWQTLQSHSVNVREMAAEFARIFSAQEMCYQKESCRSK
jgi:CRISPR-associated helicase Cas3 domain protein